MELLAGFEVDQLFRWPHGRAERLARRGQIPSYLLPDGSIRFSRTEIEALVLRPAQPVALPDSSNTLPTKPKVHANQSDPMAASVKAEQGVQQEASVGADASRRHNMLYEVTYVDGSVEQLYGDTIADARSQAQELYEIPVAKVVALGDPDDEGVSESESELEESEEDEEPEDSDENPFGDPFAEEEETDEDDDQED